MSCCGTKVLFAQMNGLSEIAFERRERLRLMSELYEMRQ
jgi:hypothetical protein